MLKDPHPNGNLAPFFCRFHFYFRATIRSEGSIEIVKKFDFDFFYYFDSTSLPQSKNVF